MARKVKKRNKKYTGAGSAQTQPAVTRLSAVNRSALSQWWLDNKRIAKPVGITVLVVLGLVWLIAELIRIASGA